MKKKRQLSDTYESGTGVPTLAGQADSKLKLSVITSSTENLMIAELLAELWAVRVFAVDFYPRGCDVQAALDIGRTELEGTSLLDRFCNDKSGAFINCFAGYVENEKARCAKIIDKAYGVQIDPATFQIPALATFFPEISSFDDHLAQKAGDAIVGAVRLASALKAKVVEFVLGRTIERCQNPPSGYEDTRLRCDYIHMAKHKERIKRVVDVLKNVVVKQIRELPGVSGVRLAAEIEPGYSFILNSHEHVDEFLTELSDQGIIQDVGLNLDIGHALILSEFVDDEDRIKITPKTAELWTQHIFHSHVSDNIGYHFRDLVPGQCHHLLGSDGGRTFCEWIEFCAKCSAENDNFTRYLALELEACSRTQWIQASLLRLGYVIREVLEKF